MARAPGDIVQIADINEVVINPATEEKQDAIIEAINNAPPPVGGALETTLSDLRDTTFWFKTIIRLLKPLSIVTGAGSNHLSVDVNSGTITTVTTVTTVATVTNVANQTLLGNVAAFTLQQTMLRNSFANGLRRNIV